MTREEIRRALARVRDAAGALRERRADQVLGVLGDVLEEWRNPASAPRRRLARELPAAAGFSEPVVERGLELALEPWSREALRELWNREVDPEAMGFPTTAVLLAGAIPMPSLLALLAPLALRSGVLARPASRDPVTADAVAESLRARDPELGEALAVVSFDHADAAALGEFVAADCVVATGSDSTVRTIAERTRGALVARGHRLSVAAVGGAADPAAVADALAVDVALWDQLGCLSPIAAYVVGSREAAHRMAEALGDALAAAEQELPRGSVPAAAAARISQERAEAEFRAAAGRGVALYTGSTWTVVAEADARPRPAPLHRFVRVHPVPDLTALERALAPYAEHLAAIGHAGVQLPNTLGASRTCPLGRMQAPPLTWRQDGIGVLAPLVSQRR